MSKHTINSESSLSILIGLLRTTFKEKRYFQVTLNTGKKRSNDQNSTSHCWYLQISREEGQHTPEEVKCLCKYHIGLPILRGDDMCIIGIMGEAYPCKRDIFEASYEAVAE